MNVLWASLFYSLMIFSGNFQFVYGATVFALFFLWLTGDGGRGFPLIVVIRNIVPAFLIGALIGAIQLIPQYELAMLSERAGSLFDPAEGSLNWNNLISLGAPLLYGSADTGVVEGTFYGYIGYLGMLLAIIGVVSSPRKIRALALVVICIVFGFGGFTSLGLFRMASRMLFFLAFALGMYAGLGFDTIIRNSRGAISTRRAIAISSVVVIILALLTGTYYSISRTSGFFWLLAPQIIVIAFAFLLPAFRGRYRGAVTAVAIFIALVGSFCVHSILDTSAAVRHDIVSGTPEVADYLKRTADDGRVWISLAVDEQDARRFHSAACGPRVSMCGLATTDHETPLYIDGVRRFQRKMLASFARPAQGEGVDDTPRADILAGLKYIAVNPEDAGNLRYREIYRVTDTAPPYSVMKLEDFRGLAFFIFPHEVEFVSGRDAEMNIEGFTLDGDGRAKYLLLEGPEKEINKTPGGSRANVIEPFGEPNRWRIEYSAPEGSFMFISLIHYPGWKAYLNGREVPLYRAYGLFCGVVVDEEEGLIELIYKPASWRTGGIISVVALCFWAAMFLLVRRHGQTRR
jgi:hypothetical protein